jgi:ribose/xylose/arabinose/galactoside ABC-type transport system permease subunit
MTRILVTLGIILVIVGIAWPWLAKSGLGRLPGDIMIERENYRFYFPLTTMILLSLFLSLLLWLFRK